jgi:hypothetical protein
MRRNKKRPQLAIFGLPTLRFVDSETNPSVIFDERRQTLPMDLRAVEFEIGLIRGEQARAMFQEKRFPRVHFDLGDPTFLAILNGRGNDGAVATSFANTKVKGFPLCLEDVFDLLPSSALSPV